MSATPRFGASAESGAQVQKVPEALVDVGEFGENIYDLAKANDWAKATAKFKALVGAVKGLPSDLKEAQTERHSKRVTAYAIGIAKTMGISPDEIRVIARGAFLHDIGKMAIPDQILTKPGPLDTSEWRIMREYCLRGYQIVKKIPFLSEAAEIVYAHQERYDGTGYPRGLKETDIPLGARIVAIANTLDAITSNRPYRAAQSLDFAREEIGRWSGRQFDPDIVKIFLSMPANIWEALRTDIGPAH